MSRYFIESKILEAAEIWKTKAFLKSGSIFSAQKLWTIEGLKELEQHFVNNPDASDGRFWPKLESQLAPTSPQVKQLAAEMNWLLLLCPSNISIENKQINIANVWAWSGSPLPDSASLLLDSTTLKGVGSAGPGFNNHRWLELAYCIKVCLAFKNLQKTEQENLISDGWQFAEWLQSTQKSSSRQFRHMLLFLLFPDNFERIFSSGDRKAVALAFSSLSQKQVNKLTPFELDKKLFSIRTELETQSPTAELDFYEAPLNVRWGAMEFKPATEEFLLDSEAPITETLRKFIAQAQAGKSLSTSNYRKSYRNLSIAVSFGQGNYAHIPWIGFFGTDQRPQNGIYPVFLLYKQLNILTLAYGISETEHPDLAWDLPQTVPSIKQYFSEHYGQDPMRYGSSLLAEVFDLNQNIDYSKLSEALDKMIDQYLLAFNALNQSVSEYVVPPHYSINDALKELFMPREALEGMIERLKRKHNIILQGPPGVGKTFVAQRLAYAFMNEADPDRVAMVQFHASYSYEDFVQGYRPSNNGFKLKNGVFYEFCVKAQNDPNRKYVFIIDEINRTNLSKVFGELLMLIEGDKRNISIPLIYSDSIAQKFGVPKNVYIIGLMNTADRSLAMVDYALRRRFVFIDVAPGFDTEAFKDFLLAKGAENDLIQRIIKDMADLNDEIENDRANLGRGFCIGHSYFCSLSSDNEAADKWYQDVIRWEILPLLREYWFDDSKKLESWEQRLLQA